MKIYRSPDEAVTPKIMAPRESRSRSGRAHFADACLTILPIPLLLGAFLYLQMPPGRIVLGLIAMGAACVGVARWTTAAAAGRRDLGAVMLLAGGLGISVSLLWNEAFLNFVKLLDGHKEVFRAVMWRYYAPLYGRQRTSSLLSTVPLLIVAAGACVAAWTWNPTKPLKGWGLAVIMAVQLLLIAALAATDIGGPDGVTRLAGRSYGFEQFRRDARIFRSVKEVFAAYVPSMHRLSWFGHHYPPGPVLLFVVGRVHHLEWITGWVTSLCVCLATPFVYGSAAAVSERPLVRNAAVVAYVLASGGLLFPLISVTPACVLTGSVVTWAFLRGLKSTRAAVPWGAVLGVALVAFTLLSFSSFFFVLVIALLWSACGHWRLVPFGRLLALATAAAVAAGEAYHLLWHYLRFDLMTCSMVAVYFHHLQMRSNGFDSPGQWFMRSTCNLLAFCVANLPLLGLAIPAAFVRRFPTGRRLDRLVTPAVAVVIVYCAFCGKFYAETERIWTVFLPWIAIGAGVELARHDDPDDVRRSAVLMILFVVVQEVLFVHGVF